MRRRLRLARHVPDCGLPATVLRPALVLIRVEIVLVTLHVLAAALNLYPGQRQAFLPVVGGLASLLLLLLLASPVLTLLRAGDQVMLTGPQARALRRRALLIALLSLLPGALTLLLGGLGRR